VQRELGAVLQSLATAGVTPVLLKGAALARTVCDNPGPRPMDDVDLLLREADVPAALRELAALGYATLPAWGARLRYMGAHLFPPAAYMRRRYRIRSALLLALYYPGRWAFAVGSGLVHAATLVTRRARRTAAR
jgi:hypothetical protein